MKIFIFSHENINQRSINQFFGKTLAKEVEFVALPGLLVNRKIIK